MHFPTLATTSVLPILALAAPATHLGLPVSIPAVVPNSVASAAASAIANLPVPVSISVAIPTAVPTSAPTGEGSSAPAEPIPHLRIPPATLINNIEASEDILDIVKALLDPESAVYDNIVLPPGQLGGGTDEINGGLVTTLVTSARDLLSLAPGGAPGADTPE